ncbi:MAG: two-component sensor histidine kinase, partial [Alphaproteobacteria bacterium]|nr:two-component sensor histidine kinase [Alphaproteobacteria bacterium]
MLMIILTPMILVQVVTVLIFYERHWDTVTRYMAANLAADMTVVVDRLATDKSETRIADIKDYAWSYFYFEVSWQDDGILTKQGTTAPVTYAPVTYAGETFRNSLENRLRYPFETDLTSDPERIIV